ncbi:DNA-3-methyladenine glycosylase [Xylella fastidiosa subsp. morus]|uniref:DNA-3-methyladenine glycosylase II n=1 Tax=Xylella fastidiosa subsp. multiplex TaxID=644357 RepID=A0AAW6HWC8_XYLFS|nr:DNA-3-methyladenine glycosylase [Xylella fastidiosa]AIC12112.1 DNA-3-methyladenine glycosylase [Xylella fastidiosa MUL0034]EWG14544.1 DNA-3-methyladenine glycosidase [Xylella fastidiosa Mul-MD]KFA41211.1 DNA-3-methyladenine glycosidase [Xylella fastidiosa]MCH7234893.1 DNA-3-methyladenine glycosylase [Xylella fastidiosa subsp. multiplex]MCO5545570.1 DNA-3-methyladenine glycosidase [Xylella fastidiosa]
MAWYPRGFDVVAAYDHLYHCDPGLSGWMQRLGPLPALRGWRQPFNVVDALARAILFQQLSGKAASTIVARIEAVIGSTCLYAETLACIDDACLRACGVSSNKILALRDLTRREVAGELPSVRQMGAMHHNTIVEKLIPIRGIGRWTVEMMLMFRLGRPDVLPVDDLGVRKGIQRVDSLAFVPTPKALCIRGECWAPYRTYAGLYLWRIADFHEGEGAMISDRSQDE